MSLRRRPTKAEKQHARALVAVLEPDPPRPTLWQRMSHAQGTCGPVSCPLCALGTTVPKAGAG
jgi:hypothetical protein